MERRMVEERDEAGEIRKLRRCVSSLARLEKCKIHSSRSRKFAKKLRNTSPCISIPMNEQSKYTQFKTCLYNWVICKYK